MQSGFDFDVCPEGDLGPAPVRSRRAHVRQGLVFRDVPETALVPVDFRDLVPEGDACLWIREGLLRVDLTCVRELYTDCGGVAYEPRAMLGILLYAYLEGDSGSRTVEKRCRRDVAYMHVGYGQKPDDRTIRRCIGPALDEVFRLVMLACKEEGLLPMRRVALDGTKIASPASQMKRWLSKSDREDLEEMGLEPDGCSDPDSRNVGASGKFVRGYNCQAAVDCDSGIVVAVGVTNVNSDGGLLAPMVRKVVENAAQAPAEIVADAGYDQNEGICACAELGIEAIVAPQSPVATFWSATPQGEIVCPMGGVAEPMGVCVKQGRTIRTYRVLVCRTCPFFKECCGACGCRELTLPDGCDPLERLNSAYRARSPEGKAAMRERLGAIEPVFADVKWNIGMTRFQLRGMDGARIEWTLVHLARNLRKLGKALRALLVAILTAICGKGSTNPIPRRRTIIPLH